MAVPQVAIVGRPNVGKSSVFNWLSGRRIAIVDDVAGVTRDRLNQLIEYEDRFFDVVDTGGIGIEDVDNLTKEVEEQISAAIDSAELGAGRIADAECGGQAKRVPLQAAVNMGIDGHIDGLAGRFVK